MVQSCIAWCCVWSSIEHYGIKLYSMVLVMVQNRALLYKVVWHDVGHGAG